MSKQISKQINMAPGASVNGVPPVKAPYLVPVVSDMTPGSGASGSIVNFRGKHLTGWAAQVTAGGVRLPAISDLPGDSFNVTLPPNLNPGFHEIRVDVFHLCRQTFFFQVTK